MLGGISTSESQTACFGSLVLDHLPSQTTSSTTTTMDRRQRMPEWHPLLSKGMFVLLLYLFIH